MANLTVLKNAITEVIKQNDNQEITGEVLQNTLLSVVSTVGENRTFAGVAVLDTNPGVPDCNVFYIAILPGVYPNFGGVNVAAKGLTILTNNSNNSWSARNILWVTDTVTDNNMAVPTNAAVKNFISDISTDVDTLSDAVDTLTNDVANLNGIEGSIEQLQSMLHFLFNVESPDITLVNSKFINKNGNVSNSTSPVAYTKPISLKKGETIYIIGSFSEVVAPIAYVLTDGLSYRPIKLAENTAEMAVSYTATDDCEVALSFFTNKPYTILKYSLAEIVPLFNNRLDFSDAKNEYWDDTSNTFKPGNNIIFSKTIDARKDSISKIFYNAPSGAMTTTKMSFVVLLDENKQKVSNFHQFSSNSVLLSNFVYIDTSKVAYVVIQNTVANKNDTFVWLGYDTEIAVKHDMHFDLLSEAATSRCADEFNVGNATFKTIVSKPTVFTAKQPGKAYKSIDYKSTFAQYKSLNGENKPMLDGVLQMAGDEISFLPTNTQYTRIIIGKDSEDNFYIAYVTSQKNPGGDMRYNKLEVTKDFKTFTTLWKGSNNTTDTGIYATNAVNIVPLQLREMPDGSLIIATQYTDYSKPYTDSAGNTENSRYLGYFRMSKDRASIALCQGTSLDGSVTYVQGTHAALNGTYTTNSVYDWSMFAYGNKIIVAEYGTRNPVTDWGRTWYSEDCGITWKEIFRSLNHYNDGAQNSVSFVHIHGVMIDIYTGYLFVIAGEDNSNLFYSTKGFNTTDNDWICIPIRHKLIDPINTSYTQLVNGMPFENCILFGSDFSNFGGLIRLNRLPDGKFSEPEVAYELPVQFGGTKYCAGGSFRRDNATPYLMCITRENNETTESANEQLMQKHLGTIVASWDGYSFHELWKDPTYGPHEVRVNNSIVTRNFCYCTRDMTAWLCKNGDLVIKYSGRQHVYLGSTDYLAGFGDFCAKVKVIKNAVNYLL